MSDLETPVEGATSLDPDVVEAQSFATAFRGFDPVQVRAFLGLVADELRRLHHVEADLRAQLGGDEVEPAVASPSDAQGEELAEAKIGASEPVVLDDERRQADDLVAAAKLEAEDLLRQAREKVEALSAAAAAETTRVVEEAKAEAERVRTAAVAERRSRAEDAEATAVRKIAEAEREAAGLRVAAREEADATIEAARERGREMVSEAQAARERMLADLAKRRRAAQAQLEQMRANRDRLLETLKVARRTIDEMTNRFDPPEPGRPASTSETGGPTGPSMSPSAPVDDRPSESRAPRTATISTTPERVQEAPRPRARAVVIGEAPAAARPRISAPQAEAAVSSRPVAPPASPPDATEHVRVTRPTPARDERRSSALRILRRGKNTPPAEPSSMVGRDSPADGVRIIGRADDAADVPAEATDRDPVDGPETAALLREAQALPEPEPEPEPERETAAEPDDNGDGETPDPSPLWDQGIDDSGPVEGADGIDSGDEGLDGDGEPIVLEEIRPRIEDLFARLRADRAAATSAAREVLGHDGEEPEGGESVAPIGTGAPGPRPGANDGDEHLLQARDSVVDPLVGQLAKRLKRVLQDEQNASLDRLRTGRGQATVESVLSRAADQSLPYRHVALPILDAAAQAGASVSAFGTLAVPVEDLGVQLAGDLAGAIRARLDAVLRASASDDLDLASTGERVSAVYREWKTQKIERLATHYLIGAHERGAFLAHPEGQPLRWLVDDDGPCPDCDDNALAGPTPRGEPFPTGQLHPPAHLGCRCRLVAAPA